jgi:hypothetical protein
MVGGVELQSDPAFAKMGDSEIVAKIERIVLQGFSLKSTHLRAILDDFTQDACPDSLRELLKGPVAS